MIAALGGFLVRFGLSMIGNLILDWSKSRQAAAQNTAEQAGANKQVIRDTADSAAGESRIAQAEAQTDKTQDGIVAAAREGKF